MKKSTIIIGSIVAAILVIVGIYAVTGSEDDPGTTSGTDTSQNTDNSDSADSTDASDTDEAVAGDTIAYTDSGFSPATLTVTAGTTITIKNDSTQELQFNSDQHPIHTDNSDLNVGDVAPGESKTFTISEAGTWGYHNHLNSGDGGEIIVE